MVYVDTSALAKWYVNEEFSEDFENFINHIGQGLTARLAVVEFRCLLARKRRAGEISGAVENGSFRAFERDVKDGFWRIEPMDDGHFLTALDLVERLKKPPVRTLDALHLAVAKAMRVAMLATADKSLADAARQLDMEIRTFF